MKDREIRNLVARALAFVEDTDSLEGEERQDLLEALDSLFNELCERESGAHNLARPQT